MELINISKSYGNKLIFNNLNYKFQRGKVYWIHGKNGVGKSTLIRLLIGMECPDAGNINGKVGSTLYIPEIPLTEDWLTVSENIALLYKVSCLKALPNLDWGKCLLIKDEDMSSLSMNCSLGTNMKISFSLIYTESVIHLIVIDEAFSHIDQDFQICLIKRLKQYAELHNSIIIFTHHDSFNLENIFVTIKQLILTKERLYEK